MGPLSLVRLKGRNNSEPEVQKWQRVPLPSRRDAKTTHATGSRCHVVVGQRLGDSKTARCDDCAMLRLCDPTTFRFQEACGLGSVDGQTRKLDHGLVLLDLRVSTLRICRWLTMDATVFTGGTAGTTKTKTTPPPAAPPGRPGTYVLDTLGSTNRPNFSISLAWSDE